MDRRTFVTTSLGAAATGCATPWLDCYGVLSNSRETVLVLLDSTLAASRAFASIASIASISNEQGACRLDIGTDVGLLWHRQLRDWPGTMRGVLRPSDCFVLRNFSVADGRAFGSQKTGAGTIAFVIGATAGHWKRR